MIPFQQPSDWAYWAAEAWKGNTFIRKDLSAQNEHFSTNLYSFSHSIQSELFGLSIQTGHFSKSIYGAAKGTKMNCFPTAFKLKWVKWLEVYERNTFPTFFIPQQNVWIEHSSNSLQIEVIRTA